MYFLFYVYKHFDLYSFEMSEKNNNKDFSDNNQESYRKKGVFSELHILSKFQNNGFTNEKFFSKFWINSANNEASFIY